MFSHHRDNLSRIEAGTKRRDKRMKKNLAGVYPIMMEDRDDGRSRSVSVASIDSPSHAAKTPSSQVEEKAQTSESSTTEKKQSRSHTCISPGIPDITSVSITRKEGEKWGILLLKESNMCVVMKVPQGSDLGLKIGDLIVSIRNEQNEIVYTPSSHSNSVSEDWFTQATGIFKRSHSLDLELRRIQS